MNNISGLVMLDKNLDQEFKYIRREFSIIEAMFSYSLDIMNNSEKSILGYSVMWSWSRNRVKRFIYDIRSPSGFKKDSKRTVKGQAIIFVGKDGTTKKDSKRTVKGHQRRKKPELDFTEYLQSKVVDNNFIEIKNKIYEFYTWRMTTKIKGKYYRYETEKGIDGLIRDLNGCREKGLDVSMCIDIAMEKPWRTPSPDYFKNKPINGKPNHNKDACQEFINEAGNER